jgi:uncharacterized protein (TIGR02996 family)
MSDLHALIRACKDEPDDDAPRLILADWLEEHGEFDRPAFIRWQLSKHQSESKFVPKEEWLGAWKTWGDESLKRSDPADEPKHPVQFRRGFMHIEDSRHELFDSLDEIVNPPFEWSWVESVEFDSWHIGDWTQLFKAPVLLELNELAFFGDMGSPILTTPLAASSYLRNLKSLRLPFIHFSDDGLAALSQSAALSRIRRLHAYHCAIGERGVSAFANSEVWDQLTELNLDTNAIGDAGVAALANGRTRPRLANLDISHSGCSDSGLIELSQSDRFPALRELGLGYGLEPYPFPRGVKLSRDGVEAILNSEHFQNCNVCIWIKRKDEVADELLQLEVAFPERLRISDD